MTAALPAPLPLLGVVKSDEKEDVLENVPAFEFNPRQHQRCVHVSLRTWGGGIRRAPSLVRERVRVPPIGVVMRQDLGTSVTGPTQPNQHALPRQESNIITKRRGATIVPFTAAFILLRASGMVNAHARTAITK